ncbi:heavy metal translocating P-type ATPase [Clostridium sp. MT-14]|uniref:Cd(2+)-exporting ATPase n=1 Tax=Clostridium aromativorans TaxID=2836848 RepID=A0ABS8N4X6_9CLOT|nr:MULTISPECIES: heavy metal translocating P-type ATPase [Clostridium]KAA8664168.1 cadmium-translocating P-type ATPase [Clostridium sp. HV4-5-A1G]MCC9294849.1 cadmium-translocating P-type ATPase [Clostridium aromativorans]CAB1250540.1 Cd(II), Zn(II) and Co(II) exporter (ATPase) [Clostridiaceae bacterium BL-3]
MNVTVDGKLSDSRIIDVKGNDKKREFILENLCCANCASKIESRVKNIPEIKTAYLDFLSKKLIVQLEDEQKLDYVVKKIENIINTIEPEVKVLYGTKNLKSEEKGNCDETKNNRMENIIQGIGVVLYISAIIFNFQFKIEMTLYLISYIIIGREILLKAFRNIIRGQVFDENFLMCIASIGALSIKQFPEAVAVMLFYRIGEYFQDRAVDNSRKSISNLMNIKPDFASVKVEDGVKKMAPEEVNIGDIILIKPGEKIPLDGKVINGDSMIDTSALTGESLPKKVSIGDEVLGGFINKNGVLSVKVTKEFGQSTVARILDLVQNASSKKAPTENFITKFARYYTPAVVILSFMLAVLPPVLMSGETFSDWFYRALIFLVVSCPCALVISIPLGFFGGIGSASKNGILVKGGNYLEALNDVNTVVFDKTGTLTKGVFEVAKVKNCGDFKEEDILKYASYAESYSNHPISTSILRAYNKGIERNLIKDYNEIPGKGIQANVNGVQVLVGNGNLMLDNKIAGEKVQEIGTVVHVAVDRNYAGYIVISDEIKEDSREAVESLKKVGIGKVIMLTGDSYSAGKKVAENIGLDEVYTELLPDGKVKKLEEIYGRNNGRHKLAFVGDGINDAPVLARADVGVAMGGIGSDAAIEAADVVIMTDEPSKIPVAIKIARKTKKIVVQNIVIALGVKFVILVLGALGIANIWEAVFGDVGVALIAVFNSMRTMRF